MSMREEVHIGDSCVCCVWIVAGEAKVDRDQQQERRMPTSDNLSSDFEARFELFCFRPCLVIKCPGLET